MRKIPLLYLGLLIGLLVSGCAASHEEIPSERAAADVQEGSTRVYKRQTPYRQYNTVNPSGSQEGESAELRAQRIGERLEELDELSMAAVVVTDNTAIVGIRAAGETDERALLKLKQKVEREVKAADKDIVHVAVTAAPDLVNRLLELSGQGEGGRPGEPEEEEVVTGLGPVV